MHTLITLVLSGLIFVTPLMAENIKAEYYLNGSQSKTKFQPGQPINVEIVLNDLEKKEVIKDFKVMHGKYMHMVIYKKDLSVLQHVHPYFDPITGRFFITLNMPIQDPDNQDIPNALIEPGEYMIMADVDIRFVGMRMFMQKIKIAGKPKMYHLMEDKTVGKDHYQKVFQVQKGKIQETIKVDFQFEKVSGQDGTLINFYADLKFKNGQSNKYNYDNKNFSPWLDAGGHAIILSNPMHHGPHDHDHHHFIQANPLMMKGFAHMHAVLPPPEVTESIFLFSFYDKNILRKGLNKIWLQFRYKNEVLKLPIVFKY
ncbi:hypothetical protein N9N67_07585 [Bacteriovoracaceae bacterium]|nr:hypothetical protein [Bacteriovoracaceae bacterium]